MEVVLFNLDSSAYFFNLLFNIGSFIFGNAFFNGLGHTFHQIFGLFQAQPGDRPNHLDHLYFFRAESGQDRIKLCLLLRYRSCAACRLAGRFVRSLARP